MTQKYNMQNYKELRASREENCRIFGGTLNWDDFSTSHPNPLRVGKISREIDAYLRYKRRNEM